MPSSVIDGTAGNATSIRSDSSLEHDVSRTGSIRQNAPIHDLINRVFATNIYTDHLGAENGRIIAQSKSSEKDDASHGKRNVPAFELRDVTGRKPSEFLTDIGAIRISAAPNS